MNILISLSSSTEINPPPFEPKRKASDLRSSAEYQEEELSSHFSKALKINQVVNDAPANWLQTKRKVLETVEAESNASKKVKSVIEAHEEEIPFKKNHGKEPGGIENERKRLKPTDDTSPEACGVVEIAPDAPSWEDIEELDKVMSALAMLYRLETEPLDRILACLSKRGRDKRPIVVHERVFDKLIEVLCSFADAGREKILAIFSIRDRHGSCLLSDKRLYQMAFPYLENLMEWNPDMLLDLLGIKDKWGDYAFMAVGLSGAIKELFYLLALKSPEKMLNLIGLPLADGRIVMKYHWTLSELLDVAPALSEKEPNFVFELFSMIVKDGGFYLTRPEYVEQIVKCLTSMRVMSYDLVRAIMTEKHEAGSMLSYPEFTVQAKSLLKSYPGLQPKVSPSREIPPLGLRGHGPLRSKTDMINRQPNG